MSKQEQLIVDSGPELERAGLVHRVRCGSGQGPHPTIVMIHGRSGNEEVMWIFERTLPKEWLLVAPRAIEEDPRGGYSWRVREKEDWPTLAAFEAPVGAIVDFIHALPQLYDADPNNIYLMGFSQGAAASYAVAMHYPQMQQGIAGLVGFVPMDCSDLAAAEPLAGLPIFMAVGKRDEAIPYERSVACAHTLLLAGADLDYHEYDMRHRLNSEAMRDLKGWWQKQAQATAARRAHNHPS